MTLKTKTQIERELAKTHPVTAVDTSKRYTTGYKNGYNAGIISALKWVLGKEEWTEHEDLVREE